MEWNNQVYIDTCLPFGLQSATKLYTILADLLSWIAIDKGVSSVHYLDDFLTVSRPGTHTCQHNLETIQLICTDLGIFLALVKVEDLTTSLTFLCIVLGTHRMEICLSGDKLYWIQQELSAWLHKMKATKREILSFVGLRQQATKVVKKGRTFVARMYQTDLPKSDFNTHSFHIGVATPAKAAHISDVHIKMLGKCESDISRLTVVSRAAK